MPVIALVPITDDVFMLVGCGVYRVFTWNDVQLFNAASFGGVF